MGAAVAVAVMLVLVFCCYVYAYACVTVANIEKASLSRALRKAKLDQDALGAEVSRLSLLSTVERRALHMGMVPASPDAAMVLSPAAASGHLVAQTAN